MTFKGQPNLYVRISQKYIQRATGKKGFMFDENGRYETDNPILIKLLSQHFPIEESDNEAAEQPKSEETKVFKCKQCDFETGNKGLLLAHYREHKKG